MPASTEGVPRPILASGEGRRAGRELLLETVFRPLSNLLVRPLARLHVPPPAVVLANALAIEGGSLVLGALLLQLKTLLDNTDGQLARATGRVALTGRYLDTIADLVVNVALFVALAHGTGRPVLAALGLAALTLVLAVDFNVSELAREALGLGDGPPRRSGSRFERLLGGVYAAVFAPQDRLVRAVSERRLEAAVGRSSPLADEHRARLAYFDSVTLAVLANLGLTTQLAVLGACLALGAPELYLWLALASALALIPLQLRRESLVRRAVRA
jgi:phosphatidylglycerophosphate synthase